MTGLYRAGPKKHQGHVGGVDGAMRPKGRDVRDLARGEFRRAGRAVLTFEQHQPVAREGLVGFSVITLAVVMAAGDVIFRTHLSWVNDGGAEKEIPFGLAIANAIVLVANRVIFFPDPSL